MKGGRDAARLAHRTRYFATREGVQLLKDDNAHLPATKKQQKYIQRLLRSFPEAKELPEHEDYATEPNRQTAFDLIEQIHEDFVEPMGSRENYLDYVANRPGVKSLGEHGLWNADGKVTSLENAIAEVAQHQGNVWTPIISLSRQNAERLGYTDLEIGRHLSTPPSQTSLRAIRSIRIICVGMPHSTKKRSISMSTWSFSPPTQRKVSSPSKVSAVSSPHWSARSTGTTVCTSTRRKIIKEVFYNRKQKNRWLLS